MRGKAQFLSLLMSLTFTQGTVLKKRVLENVLNTFIDEFPEDIYNAEEFSFILVLPAPECVGDRPPEILATVNSGHRSRSMKKGPAFSHTTADFLDPTNHMALYSELDESCPEERLLSNPNRSWFSAQKGVTSRLPDDSSGCVVFFTRYAPCEGSCLNSHVIQLLEDTPFSDRWTESNGIHKYFVYTSEFGEGRNGRCSGRSLLPQLTASAGKTTSPFSPWNCIRTGKGYKCQD